MALFFSRIGLQLAWVALGFCSEPNTVIGGSATFVDDSSPSTKNSSSVQQLIQIIITGHANAQFSVLKPESIWMESLTSGYDWLMENYGHYWEWIFDPFSLSTLLALYWFSKGLRIVLMHWFQKLTSIRHPMAFMKTRSMAAMTRYDVSHDLTKFKFFIKLSPTDEAKLEYDCEKDLIDMYHTEVPPQFQGKGIAAILAKAAFDYAAANELKMKLSCTYLQKYYHDNPKAEYQPWVVIPN